MFLTEGNFTSKVALNTKFNTDEKLLFQLIVTQQSTL